MRRGYELSIFFSAIMLLSSFTPLVVGDLSDVSGERRWCQVGDERANNPAWKDGMYNSMDMAFFGNSSKLIISEWPNSSLDSPIISTWNISARNMTEIGSGSLPFPGGVDYSGNTQCGINIAIFEGFGWPMLVVARCLSENTQVVELYNFTDDLVVQPESRVELLNISNPGWSYMHHLGRVGVADDGSLWIFNGYNNQKDPEKAAQSPETLHGSIIRGVVSENFSLEPHPQNPGVVSNSTWNPMIHSIGLRMPWRAVSDDNGNWWVGDVGGAISENVFRVNETGMNFGYSTDSLQRCLNCSGVEQPWISYTHEYNDSFNLEDPDAFYSYWAAVYVGAYIPEDESYPEDLRGRVIIGDFTRGWMRSVDVNNRGESEQFSHLTGVVDMETSGGNIFALRTGVQVSEEVRDPGLWFFSEGDCSELLESQNELPTEPLPQEEDPSDILAYFVCFLFLSVVAIFFMLFSDDE